MDQQQLQFQQQQQLHQALAAQQQQQLQLQQLQQLQNAGQQQGVCYMMPSAKSSGTSPYSSALPQQVVRLPGGNAGIQNAGWAGMPFPGQVTSPCTTTSFPRLTQCMCPRNRGRTGSCRHGRLKNPRSAYRGSLLFVKCITPPFP
jgi:hypothetical protein